MATPRGSNPTLEIDIGFNDSSRKVAEADIERIVVASGRVTEQKRAAAIKQVQDVEAAKYSAREKQHAQRLEQMRETMNKRWQIQDERQRARILAGHTTWSQKMVTLNERIAHSTGTMASIMGRGGGAGAAVSGFMQIAIRNSSALVDMAGAIGLNVGQMEELSVTAGKAGVPVSRLNQLMLALTNATSSPTAAQESVIAKLGLNAEGLTAVRLFDAAILGLKSNVITIADATELVGARGTYALSAVANEMDGLLESSSNAGRALSDVAKTEDELGAAYDRGSLALTKFIGWNVKAIEGLWGFKNLSHNIVADLNNWGVALGIIKERSVFLPQHVSDMGDAVANTTEEFLRLATVEGPYIDEATRSRLEAIAVQREFTEGVFAEYFAQEKANKETERANALIAKYIENQMKLSSITDVSFGSRGNLLSGIPQLKREKVSAEPTGPDAIDDVIAMGEAAEAAREYTKTLLELKAGGQLTADQLAAVNQLLDKQSQALNNAIAVMQSVSGIASSLGDLWSVQTQNEIMHYQIMMDMENQRWDERSNRLRAAGLESTAAYRNEARQQESSQRAMQKRMTQLQAKAWEQSQDAKSVDVVMNSAVAIMRTYAEYGMSPMGIVMAALMAAQTGIQLATISSQRNPYKGFATGGIVGGAGFFDNQMIAATSGEAVVSRSNTQRNAAALEFIDRGGTVQPGGGSFTVHLHGPIMGTQEFVDDTLLPKLRKAFRNGHRLN